MTVKRIILFASGLAVCVLLLITSILVNIHSIQKKANCSPNPPRPPVIPTPLDIACPVHNASPFVITGDTSVPPASKPEKPVALTVNQEIPGFTKSPGYDYPNENAGKKIYPETEEYYSFYPIARSVTQWLLADSPKSNTPVWLPLHAVVFLENSGLEKLPFFDKLPKIEIKIPDQFPSGKSVEGVVTNPFGEGNPFPYSINCYSAPEHKGDIVAKLASGKKVRGLAILPEGLDILIEAEGLKDRVWIWKTDIQWKDREWMQIDGNLLPVLTPLVTEKTEYPEIIKPFFPSEIIQSALETQKPITLVIHDTMKNPHPWNQRIPKEWQTAQENEARFDVLVRKIPIVIDTASYLPYGLFYRIRLDYEILLIIKNSNQLAGKTILQGKPPPEAPASLKQNDPYKGIGEPPSVEDFIAWIRSYIEKNNPGH
jgi:hypothetical protein